MKNGKAVIIYFYTNAYYTGSLERMIFFYFPPVVHTIQEGWKGGYSFPLPKHSILQRFERRVFISTQP